VKVKLELVGSTISFTPPLDQQTALESVPEVVRRWMEDYVVMAKVMKPLTANSVSCEVCSVCMCACVRGCVHACVVCMCASVMRVRGCVCACAMCVCACVCVCVHVNTYVYYPLSRCAQSATMP